MLTKRKLVTVLSILLTITLVLAACSAPENAPVNTNDKDNGMVNLYTDRHYDTDQMLYDLFTSETGIKVNVVKGNSDELIERLEREGDATQADVLITADAGRLYKAMEKGLLQPVDSQILTSNIPQNLRDENNNWFGLTVRARVLVYSEAKTNESELSSYEDLTDSKWKGKLLVRSSSNIYNQSLLASMIAISGEEKTREWAQGIVENLAREPKGNDRDQATAVVSGEGDIAIMNTYYIGKMLTSSNPEEVKVAQNISVFFPNQETTGTHINVSGIGLTKSANNPQNAIKLMEFLASEEAQEIFAEANFEYPVHPDVQPAELLKSWGEFKTQDINLSLLGKYNKKATEIANEVGWK